MTENQGSGGPPELEQFEPYETGDEVARDDYGYPKESVKSRGFHLSGALKLTAIGSVACLFVESTRQVILAAPFIVIPMIFVACSFLMLLRLDETPGHDDMEGRVMVNIARYFVVLIFAAIAFVLLLLLGIVRL